MKRLFILFSVLLFVFYGCADDKKSSKSNTDIPIVDPGDDLTELQGTYNITFFGSEIPDYNEYYITDNCTKAAELLPDINNNGQNKCDGGKELKFISNQASIFVINGNINIVAKVQANGGISDEYLTYKYQYIRFNPSDKLSGQGFKERCYDELLDDFTKASKTYANDTFLLEKIDDNILKLSYTYTDKRIAFADGSNKNVNIKNIFILEKTSDETSELTQKYEQINP